MDYNIIIEWLSKYGLLFIFAISFIEHLNIPFFSAGIVYPAYGLWVKTTDSSLFLTITVSVVGSLLAAILVYALSRLFETKIRNFCKRFKRIYVKIEDYEVKLINNSFKVNFIAKLLPVVRTIVPIPCGFAKMKVSSFVISSFASLVLYNTVFICLGFLLSYSFFEIFG